MKFNTHFFKNRKIKPFDKLEKMKFYQFNKEHLWKTYRQIICSKDQMFNHLKLRLRQERPILKLLILY